MNEIDDSRETQSHGAVPALDGRVALVIGASRGIGAAVARSLGAAGAHVVAASRDIDALRILTDQIGAAGGDATPVSVDVTDDASVARLVSGVLDQLGRLDAAVNNAAMSDHHMNALADFSLDAFDDELATSLRGVFVSMRHEIPAMMAGGGGSIVNMASTAGLDAVAGLTGYVAAKFGVVGLTRTAALDYAAAGIRVNALAPGPILTDGLESAGEQAIAAAGRGVPMHRVGSVDEVAAAAVWLCSDASSFVTGTIIPIDGGKLAGAAPFQRPPTT